MIKRPNKFQRRATLVPASVRWLVTSAPIALGIFWWCTYSGLYRLLAEFQLHIFHTYYPNRTAFLTIFICLIPAVIALQIIGRRREAELSSADAAAIMADYAERRSRRNAWIRNRRKRLLGLLSTLVLLGAGAYSTVSGLLAGRQVFVEAARSNAKARAGGGRRLPAGSPQAMPWAFPGKAARLKIGTSRSYPPSGGWANRFAST